MAKGQEGVYTGFSQGGRYIKRWPDPETGLTRYTAEPTEISLVDLPCLPGATFEVVKDGAVEKRAFAVRADAPEPEPEPSREPAQSEPTDSAAAPAALASAERPPAAEVPSPSAALAKAASALALAADKLERAVAENCALRKSVGVLAPEVAALAARVAALEVPAAAGPRRLACDVEARRRFAYRRADVRRRGSDQAPRRIVARRARAGADQAQPGAPAAVAVLTHPLVPRSSFSPGAPSCWSRRCARIGPRARRSRASRRCRSSPTAR